MDDDDEQDPEVIADLRLREETTRDPTRTRGKGIYDWKSTPPAEHWPCRACGAMCPVSGEAIHGCEVFDRELVRRREQKIARAKVMFCDKCRAEGRKITADSNRRHVDSLAFLIRELKSQELSEDCLAEREIIEKIRAMHHPDVAGLVQAIRETRARENNRPGKRRL